MSAQPTSIVQVRIGGSEYALRSEPNCKTCQSPNRLYIEGELLKARSYRSIARSLVGLPEGEKGHPSHESIANHVAAGHVPLGASTQRRLIERRAKAVGKSVELSEEPLNDYITVAEMVVHKGFEMIADGRLEIKATDVIGAAKFLHQVEQEAGGDLDTQAWIEAVMVYMETAQKYIPPQAWEAYSNDLQRNPVLKALAERQANTVAGEVAEG